MVAFSASPALSRSSKSLSSSGSQFLGLRKGTGLDLGATDVSGWIILRRVCREDCPVHWRVFSSVPGFYLLRACSVCPVATMKNVSRRCQVLPGGGKIAPIKNDWAKGSHFVGFLDRAGARIRRSLKQDGQIGD